MMEMVRRRRGEKGKGEQLKKVGEVEEEMRGKRGQRIGVRRRKKRKK